jgi:hypothetical protein
LGDLNEIWNKIKKGINEPAGIVGGKEEGPQRNSVMKKTK